MWSLFLPATRTLPGISAAAAKPALMSSFESDVSITRKGSTFKDISAKTRSSAACSSRCRKRTLAHEEVVISQIHEQLWKNEDHRSLAIVEL